MALDLLALFRKLDTLLQLDAKHGAAIERLDAEIVGLKSRVSRLEAREDVVMAEARGAASTAASAAATTVVADLARRIGALQERGRTPRLPTETQAQ